MLYSRGSARDLYGQLTNDTTAANLVNGDAYINASIGRMLTMRPWPFLYRETTGTTTASVQYVEAPANYKKITSVKITSGTSIFTPREVPNREFWDRLNSSTSASVTADFPDWWYFFNGRVHFYPTPSTVRSVTFFGRIGFQGLSVAEYTTGAILTATQGSARVVGSSATTWNASMAGRFMKIFESNVSNRGDGEWYEIASVADATNLDFKKPYRGAAITSGTATYVIGQLMPLPDGYHDAPIYDAVSKYYSVSGINYSAERSRIFKEVHDELVSQFAAEGSDTDNVIVEDASIDEQINPNLIVRL